MNNDHPVLPPAQRKRDRHLLNADENSEDATMNDANIMHILPHNKQFRGDGVHRNPTSFSSSSSLSTSSTPATNSNTYDENYYPPTNVHASSIHSSTHYQGENTTIPPMVPSSITTVTSLLSSSASSISSSILGSAPRLPSHSPSVLSSTVTSRGTSRSTTPSVTYNNTNVTNHSPSSIPRIIPDNGKITTTSSVSSSPFVSLSSTAILVPHNHPYYNSNAATVIPTLNITHPLAYPQETLTDFTMMDLGLVSPLVNTSPVAESSIVPMTTMTTMTNPYGPVQFTNTVPTIESASPFIPNRPFKTIPIVQPFEVWTISIKGIRTSPSFSSSSSSSSMFPSPSTSSSSSLSDPSYENILIGATVNDLATGYTFALTIHRWNDVRQVLAQPPNNAHNNSNTTTLINDKEITDTVCRYVVDIAVRNAITVINSAGISLTNNTTTMSTNNYSSSSSLSIDSYPILPHGIVFLETPNSLRIWNDLRKSYGTLLHIYGSQQDIDNQHYQLMLQRGDAKWACGTLQSSTFAVSSSSSSSSSLSDPRTLKDILIDPFPSSLVPEINLPNCATELCWVNTIRPSSSSTTTVPPTSLLAYPKDGEGYFDPEIIPIDDLLTVPLVPSLPLPGKYNTITSTPLILERHMNNLCERANVRAENPTVYGSLSSSSSTVHKGTSRGSPLVRLMDFLHDQKDSNSI